MKKIALFIYSLFIVNLAGFVGSIFTIQKISTWYSTLEKPLFTPPNWIFGPIWSTLYLLMSISLFLVLTSKKSKNKNFGLRLFYFQLILNALWSIVFFGTENISLGFIIILFLWGSIFLTIKVFYRFNRSAGNLLLPYIVWVTIATLLNLGVLLLNP